MVGRPTLSRLEPAGALVHDTQTDALNLAPCERFPPFRPFGGGHEPIRLVSPGTFRARVEAAPALSTVVSGGRVVARQLGQSSPQVISGCGLRPGVLERAIR
jgi:hypothetical protein